MVMKDQAYIIAEAGVNHNGSLELAKEMIDVAARAGADAVKFQTFKADMLVSKSAPKAQYQNQHTDTNESQYEMLKKLELNADMHRELIDYCDTKNIEFLSTPFDADSLELLINDCNISKIKIPSGEITNAPLIFKIAQTGKPVILSTGMSILGDIEVALGILAFGYLRLTEKPSLNRFMLAYSSKEGQAVLQEKVILLHCTTEYPTPFNEVNLRNIETLKSAFNLPVGFSDHTNGIAIPLAAVARGAVLIEKHFTLDKNLPGPDHKASLEPQELKAMIEGIRQIEQALGTTVKMPTSAEQRNKDIARKSLVLATDIYQGEVFNEDNLVIKRPGDGISPIYYWDWLGKRADRDFKQDEKVK
jgi:N-acetylneuraminate synthase